MKITRKKSLVVGIVAASLLGGSALAYWTTTGSGSGNATVGNSNGTISLTAIVAGPAIVPGEARGVTFTASNGGSSNLYVGDITLASVTVDSSHSACAVADFTMANVTSNTNVLAGASSVPITGLGSLVFANTVANQDPCKGATVTLHVTSN